jgi:hypothetical protein
MEFTQEQFVSYFSRVRDGAAAAERERWALVCELIADDALSRAELRVASVVRTLAQHMRDNNGPQLPASAIDAIVAAARVAAGIRTSGGRE